ncbi:MAG: SDR family NAD(P)-dependent oxidoreductase [Caulobacteraceae bacterium]|nr:SDR family NAD(P)-dependent oxidoreductase [Caulobacteraceae bacterium]
MARTSRPRPLALITGASGGIGESLAVRFAKAGYDVALVARSVEGLQATAARCEALKAATHIFPADLQDQASGAALEAAVRKAGLSPSAVVNNAGFGALAPFYQASMESQLGQIDLNVRVLTELCRRFTPDVVANKGGFLNVASTAAFQPGPGMAVYFASKAYVLSFTEALDYELKLQGAHATCLCPGPVETGFQARATGGATVPRRPNDNRVLTADQVADIGFKAFKARKPVVIPGGANARLAWMMKWLPRPMVLKRVAGIYYRPAPAPDVA